MNEELGPGLPVAKRADCLFLFKEDRVMCDTECNQYSLDTFKQLDQVTNPKGQFELCSDRMQRRFPSYELDEGNRFRPGPETETANFTTLKNLLLSKDLTDITKLHEMTADDKCVFLDSSVDLTGNKVAFQSFVRSGNTFLRRYIEQITGIFTGSDMGIDHTFMEAQMGLLGNNIVSDSNSVWITKTHFPHNTGKARYFTPNKMIVIARNPIDVIPSFANLTQLSSHSLEYAGQYHIDQPEFWEEFVRNMIQNCKNNHENVLNEIASNIPTYFMRYEDLKMNPEPVLDGLFRFLLDVQSLEGTVVQSRIQEVSKAGFATKTAYKLKTTSTSLSRQNHMYSQQQIDTMQTELTDMINFWNYDAGSADHTVKTDFFNIPANPDAKDYMAYNEETLSTISEPRPDAHVEFNSGSGNIPYKLAKQITEKLTIKQR